MGSGSSTQVQPVRGAGPSTGPDSDVSRAKRSAAPGKIAASGDENVASDRSTRIARATSSRRLGSKPILHGSLQGGYELEETGGLRRKLSNDVVTWFRQRNGETLQGSLAFVPWILQQSYFDGMLEEDNIVMHRGVGAVVFSDASGFTALTDELAKKSNGAEMLSDCLKSFFTPLISLINSYRGDVIKFSGDALTVYFPSHDDSQSSKSKLRVPPHGSFGLPDLGPTKTAVLRASACCIEIHKRLHNFDTHVGGVRLCLHIGVGFGPVTILQVGGEVPPETHVPRYEYIIAGPPLEQISIAEPLAHNGETCLSPQAWEHVQDCVVEDTSRKLEGHPDFHLLLKMDETKYTFPTIKYSAIQRDTRAEKQFKLTELHVIRRYVPSAVFKQIEGGTLKYVDEMRTISTIFIAGSGVDPSTDAGAAVAQDLMSSVQRVCYAYEGTLNKFVIDDKGMLFLLVFGLPPLVHTDDSTRAVRSCFDMVKVFKRLQLQSKFGVTTGRAYCGVCGSEQRMEYTVLGDTVNMSARLMGAAEAGTILTDETTKNYSTHEVVYSALDPIRVKGKKNLISVFRPSLKPPPKYIGIEPSGYVYFPWYERPLSLLAEDVEAQFRQNVQQMCSLPGWNGIKDVQGFLGGSFSADMHKERQLVPPWPQGFSGPSAQVAPSSPFAKGGVILIEGPLGVGKIELAEHLAVYAAMKLQFLPIFGTMGPRLHDLERCGIELLRSTLGAFRHIDCSLPSDDAEALMRVSSNMQTSQMQQVREALSGKLAEDKTQATLATLTDVVVSLVQSLRKQVSVQMVIQLEYGTSLFDKTLDGFGCFWTIVVANLAKLATSEDSRPYAKPVVLTVLSKEVDRTSPIVQSAMEKNSLVELSSLNDSTSHDYIAIYLGTALGVVPKPLRDFIVQVSLGNPLYMRETIDQLIQGQHLTVKKDAQSEPERVEYEEDLEGINIAAWSHTAMVGETICLLESLDPLEAAVLKMSTVFAGAFSLPDLGSSSCSAWAGATHFDYLRLFRAIQDLVRRGIVETAESTTHEGQTQNFEMKNVLIRKVGGSMVLEAQKKVVKRQALIDRALSSYLPGKMEELAAKRNEPHIPWYYENVQMPAKN